MAHKALQDKDMVQKKTTAMVKNKRIFERYEDVIESFGDDAGEELELDSANKLIPPRGAENPEVNSYEASGFHH
ncbi:hypothetical protein NW754_003587 [Fusarium falciforme]|uniref:Uncharacterized protein n=1 Tax=Fusarium falciforme TaxID=195108 RepID=A0A9W8RE36_9HYPO|nr:hypothetical protein NW754_003587 [Fusarium falciforme]KAJ4192580.1 hypothetical protein NW755_003729 [Fusarium falciforme]